MSHIHPENSDVMKARSFQLLKRRTQKQLYFRILIALVLVFIPIWVAFYITRVISVKEPRLLEVAPSLVRRSKRSIPFLANPHIKECKIDDESSSQFPSDLFTPEQRRSGAVVFHAIGLIYMFVALAIVCDEFFVPSLSVLIERLSISEDVAGATFMAAGGSAPEFFTSVFGVFVAENNVGIGTIVGSATFNILCVLAFCTLFSREVLHLTWWPLFRDMFFYIVGLLCLVLFFADEKISWDEALSLFLIYIIYGLFMKYNQQIEETVKGWLRMEDTPEPQQKVTFASAIQRGSLEVHHNREHRRSIPMIHGGTPLRNGLAHMARHSEDEQDHDHQISQPQNIIHVKPANGTHRSNGDTLFQKTNSHVPTVSGAIDSTRRKSNKIAPVEIHDKDTFSNASTAISIPMESVKEHNGNVHNIPPLAIENLSIDEDEAPLDLSFPTTWWSRFLWVLLAPIMFPLSFTLPDVRKPHMRPFFVVTFFGSVIWIAFFSYLMVWWANTIGITFHIPTEIMGLTILAAGTSIPDLITSVIVARKGLGDMAVSSSIGSNLFDICVGLPIPWLLYFFLSFLKHTTGPFPTVSVQSRGLICSVGLLFMMLIFLVISIAISKWKMDKKFGLAMIFSYVAFCIFSILLESGHILCPLRTAGDFLLPLC